MKATFENHSEEIAPNLIVYDDNRTSLGGRTEPKGAFRASFEFDAQAGREYYARLVSSSVGFSGVAHIISERDKGRSNKLYKFKVESAGEWV